MNYNIKNIKYRLLSWYNSISKDSREIISSILFIFISLIGNYISYFFWKYFNIPNSTTSSVFFTDPTFTKDQIHNKIMDQYNSIMSLGLYSLIVHYLAHVSENNTVFSLWFLLPYLIIIPLFGSLNYLAGEFVIVVDLELNMKHIIIGLIVVFILLTFIIYHVRLSYILVKKKVYNKIYHILYISRTILFMLLFFISYNILGISSKQIHIHHWSIGGITAINSRFNTNFSKLCLGIAFGIMVQGISVYGPDNLLSG